MNVGDIEPDPLADLSEEELAQWWATLKAAQPVLGPFVPDDLPDR